MKAGGLMGASEAWALQQKRIVEICWWLKPEHSALQDSTAEAWETLRRTRAYDRLFETAKAFRHENLIERMASRTAIRDIIYAKKPASVSEQAWLPLGNTTRYSSGAIYFSTTARRIAIGSNLVRSGVTRCEVSHSCRVRSAPSIIRPCTSSFASWSVIRRTPIRREPADWSGPYTI